MKTRTALTLLAAVAINVTALAALDWSVGQAQLAPHGEVTVTQLPDLTEAERLAVAGATGPVTATSGRL